MVGFEEIQTVYYMVAATGVLVAAIFYIMNLREQRRNIRLTLETRRVGMVRELTKDMQNFEYTRSFWELMNYEWKDYDDYQRKYGPENNVEATAKRGTMFIAMNSRGAMLRKGMLEIEDLYDSTGGLTVVFLWEKYKPIIEEFRRRYYGKHYMRDLEYYAGEMLRYVKARDPSYKVPETLFKYIPDK